MVRFRIYYILICVVSCQPVLTLRVGNSSKLKTYNPSNQLQWLIGFSSKVQARGDVVRDYITTQLMYLYDAVKGHLLTQYCLFFQIYLLLGGQTGQISAGCDTIDAKNDTTGLTLGLSALCVVLLWMFLPHIVVCAVICLGWTVRQHIYCSHRENHPGFHI